MWLSFLPTDFRSDKKVRVSNIETGQFDISYLKAWSFHYLFDTSHMKNHHPKFSMNAVHGANLTQRQNAGLCRLQPGFQDTHIPGSSKGKQVPWHDPGIIWTLGLRYDTKPIQRTSPAPSGIWTLGLVPASRRSDRWTGKSTAPSYKDNPRIERPPGPWTLEKT